MSLLCCCVMGYSTEEENTHTEIQHWVSPIFQSKLESLIDQVQVRTTTKIRGGAALEHVNSFELCGT